MGIVPLRQGNSEKGVTRMTIVLTFDPPQVCSIGNCQELSGIGQLSEGILMPACPVHGLMYECSQTEQFTSVCRFVNYVFDGEGAAQVLREAILEEIPNYVADPEALFTDRGWLVEWTCQDKRKRVYVVWCVDALEFEIYQ